MKVTLCDEPVRHAKKTAARSEVSSLELNNGHFSNLRAINHTYYRSFDREMLQKEKIFSKTPPTFGTFSLKFSRRLFRSRELFVFHKQVKQFMLSTFSF